VPISLAEKQTIILAREVGKGQFRRGGRAFYVRFINIFREQGKDALSEREKRRNLLSAISEKVARHNLRNKGKKKTTSISKI